MAELIATGRTPDADRAVRARPVPARPRRWPTRRRRGRADARRSTARAAGAGRSTSSSSAASAGRRRRPIDGPGRARLRRGLDLRQPRRRSTTERWFHAAGCRRWLTVRRDTPRRSRARGPLTSDGYAGRRLEILAPRPGAVRRRRRSRSCPRSSPSSARRPRSSSPTPASSAPAWPVASSTSCAPPASRSSCSTGSSRTPGPPSIERGSARLRALRRRRPRRSSSSSASAAARRWTPPRSIALHAPNQRAVMSLGYHDETVAPGRAGHRDPDDRRHGRRDEHVRRDHRRGGRAQGLRRPRERPAASSRSSTRS